MNKIAIAAILLLSIALAGNVTVTKSLIKCAGLQNCTGQPTTNLYADMDNIILVQLTVSNGGPNTVSGILWDSMPPGLAYQGNQSVDVVNKTGMFANYSSAIDALGLLSEYFPTQVVNLTTVPKFPAENKVVAWGINSSGSSQLVAIPPGANLTFNYLLSVPTIGFYTLGKAYFVTKVTGLEVIPDYYETTFCSYPGGSVEQRFSVHALATNLTNVLITSSPVTLNGNPTSYVTFNASPTFFPNIIADGLGILTATVSVAPGTPSSNNYYITTLYAGADQIPASVPVPVYIRVRDCNIPSQTLNPSIITNPRNVSIKAYPPENRSVQFRVMNTGVARGKVLVSDACGGVATPTQFFLDPGQVGSTEVRYNLYNLTSPGNCSGNVTLTLRDAADTTTIQTENIPVNMTSYPVLSGASVQFVNCTSGVQFPESSSNNYTNVYNFSVSRAKTEQVFCANNNGNVTLTDVQLVNYPLSPTTAVRWSADGSNYSDSIASLPVANTIYVKLITDGQDSQQDAYNITYTILANGARDTIASTVTLASVPASLSLSPSSIPALPCSQAVTVTNPGNEITDMTVTPYGALASYLDLYPRYERAYLGASANVTFNVSFDSYRCKLDGNGTCPPAFTTKYSLAYNASLSISPSIYSCSPDISGGSCSFIGGLNVTYNAKSSLLNITKQDIDCAANSTNAYATALSNAYMSKGEQGFALKTPAAVQTIDQNQGTVLSITFSGASSKNVTVLLNGFSLGSVQMNGTQLLGISDLSLLTYANGGINVVSLKSYGDISTINVNATNVTLAFNSTLPVFAIKPAALSLTMAPGDALNQEFILKNLGGGIISGITLSLSPGEPGVWMTKPNTIENLGPGGGLPTTRPFTLTINVPNDTGLINRTFNGHLYANSRVGTIDVPITIAVSVDSGITVIPYDASTNMTLANMSVYILSIPRFIRQVDVGIYREALTRDYIGNVHTVEVTDPAADYVPVRTSFPISAGENILRVGMQKGKILRVAVSSPFCSDVELSTGACRLAQGQNYTITVSSTLPQLEYMIKYGFQVTADAVQPPTIPDTYTRTITVTCTNPGGCNQAGGGAPGPSGPSGPSGPGLPIWGDCTTNCTLDRSGPGEAFWFPPIDVSKPCVASGISSPSLSGAIANISGAIANWTLNAADRLTGGMLSTCGGRDPGSSSQQPQGQITEISIQRTAGVPPSPLYVTGGIRELYKQVTYVLINSNVAVSASAYVNIPGESTVIQTTVTNGANAYNASENFSFLDPTITYSARNCGASIDSCVNRSAPLVTNMSLISVGGNCTGELCFVGASSLTRAIGSVENITVVANASTEPHRVIHAQRFRSAGDTLQAGSNILLPGEAYRYYGIYVRANATLNNANATRYTEEGYTLIKIIRPPYLVASLAAPNIEQGRIVKQGEFFILRATINNDNQGGRTASAISASLTRLENLEVVGANVKSIGSLTSGSTAVVEWTLRATRRGVALLAEMRAVSAEGAIGLALWSGVSQANVDLALEPNYWDWGRLPACGSASKQFYMHNNGDIDLSVNYHRVLGYASTWISSTPSSFFIPASGYTLLTLTVSIPCDIRPGHYEGIFEFVGTGRTLLLAPLRFGGEVVPNKAQLLERKADASWIDRLLLSTSNISCSNVSTNQNCSAGLDVGGASTSMSPSVVAVSASDGVSGSATVSITNRNLLLPSVDVTLQSPVGWLSFEPANLTIPQNATMNLLVKATLSRGTSPGTYQSPIYAIYNGTRDSSATVRVSVPVLASVSPASISMGDMLPGMSKGFSLNVSNPSSTVVQAELQQSDWISYSFNTLSLSPGQTAAVSGTFTVPAGTGAGGRIVTAPIFVGGQAYYVSMPVNVLSKYVTQTFNTAAFSPQDQCSGTSSSQACTLTQCASQTISINVQSNPPVFFTEPSTAHLTITPATVTPVQASWFNTTTLNISVPPSPGTGSGSIAINLPCNAPSGTFYGVIAGYASNGTSAYSLNQLYLRIDVPSDLSVAPTQVSGALAEGDSLSSSGFVQVRNTNPSYAFTNLALRFYTSGGTPIDPAWFTSLADGGSVPASSTGTPLGVLISVPPNQQPATYTGIMRLSGTFQGFSRYFDVPISLAVRPKMSISTGSISLTVPDGESRASTVTVYNNGGSSNLTNVVLSPATGYGTLPMPSGWVTYSANNFNVVPGGWRDVTINVAPPIATASGTYAAYVNVTDSIGRQQMFLLSITVPARFTGITSQSVTAYDGETSSSAAVYFYVNTVDAGSTCTTVNIRRTGTSGQFLIVEDQTWVTGRCVPIGYYGVPFHVYLPAGTPQGTYNGALTIATSTGVNQDMNVTIAVPQAVTASVSPTVATVNPGASQQINVTVTNKYYPSTVASINGTIYASGGIAAWADTNNKTFPNITSNAPYFLSAAVPFLISVPSNQDPGAYSGAFLVSSRQSYSISTTVNVPAVISTNITDITATVYDAVPYTRDFTITDTNIQNTTVSLSVTGIDASLYSLNETSFVMNKGQAKSVRFAFNSPNQYPSGVYSGNLRMTESVSGKVIDVPLNFTLNNSLDMTPTRIFSEQVPDTPVVSQYSVKNNANVPLTVTLTVEPTTSSPLNLSWASGYNATVAIPAGGTYLHNVTVTLPADAIGYFTGRVRLTTAQGHSRISELIVKSAIDMILDVC